MNTSPGLVLALVLLALGAVLRPRGLLRLVGRAQARLKDGLEQLSLKLRQSSRAASLWLLAKMGRHHEGGVHADHLRNIVGAALVGASGLAVLLGDAVLGMESVCGMLQSSCHHVSGRFDEGSMFFLSLLAGTTLWGILGAELLGLTEVAPWWKRLESNPRQRWFAGILSASMFFLGFLVLVSLALFRVRVTGGAALVGDLAAVVQSTEWIRSFTMVGGGALVAMAAPVALIALGALVELLALATGLVMVWIVLGVAAVLADAAGWISEFVGEGLQDLVCLLGSRRLGGELGPPGLGGDDPFGAGDRFRDMGDLGPGMDVPGAHRPDQPPGWQ